MPQARKVSIDPVADLSADPGALSSGEARAPAERQPLRASKAESASPARARQQLLEATWQNRQAREGRWSPRATLAFGGGIALLLWGLIGLTVYAVR